MGSLDSRTKLQSRTPNLPDDVDQVFVREQAERKIVAMRNRLELEIAAWMENVSFHLTKVGKGLLKEVEMSVNRMVIEYSRGEMRSHEELDIKFIPRSLQKSEVGFLCHGSVLPSSLSLELVTAIPDLRVGARITLAMGVEGENRISPLVRRHLALSVHTEAAEQVLCQEVSESEDGRSLLVSFETQREGQFIATATLYKQHVVGSPLVIPVLVSPGTVLEDMGLMATGLPAHHVPPGTAPGQQAAASPSSPCKPVATGGRELDVSNKYVMGALCFAKWGNDGVWYKAKIDKDCLQRGVEVTFVDYDNSDFVQRGNIVWTKEELPEGAVVDFGQDVLCVGDVVFAKWDEDDVWYNAKVLRQESGGYSVLFIDYENVAFVESDKICSEVTDIPEGECLDSNVEMLLEPQEQVVKENAAPAENVHIVPQWSVGNDCLARWVEDGRWYNAIVDTVFESSSVMSTVQYLVTFTDYGNSEIVTEDDMAADLEAVGVDQHDLLDENVVITPESVKEEVSLHQPTTHEERTRKPLVRTNFEFDAVPSQAQKTKNPIESRIFDNVPTPSSRCEVFEKGSRVIAKRDEDGTWHRAVIHEVVAAGKLYIVKYEDCGQFGGAGPSNIVLEAKDVPEGEKVADEVILRKDDEMKAVWSTGEACIARWSQDNVWYNGQVLSAGVRGSFIVRFVDYGNEDNVVEEDMVRTVLEILGDSFVDENVDQNIEEEKYQVKSEIVVPEFSARAAQIFTSAPPAIRPLKPCSQDQVRLLASAVSAAAESCQGAPKPAAAARVLMTREVSARKVPASLQCCLCGNVCRKGMRLTCNSSPVCWGCAVKEITRGHVCWQCGVRNITTDSHLVRDQVLRSLVEQFISTGKLDPAHEQALRNGRVLPDIQADRVKEEPRESVQSASSVKVKNVGLLLNDTCLVKASEDGVWYNGVVTDVYGDRSALVYFMDYGNSERVKVEDIVGGVEDVPHGEVVDANVHQMISVPIMPGQTGKVQACNTKLDFLSVATLGPDGVAVLAAQETLVIKDLAGPIGVTVLADGSLAVVCRGGNCVSRYSMGGEFLGNIIPGREFVKPSDILTLASGEVAVRDERGIQLFDGHLQFVQFVAEEWIDRCFGLAEDDDGRIITINCNANCVESLVKITNSGCTDVFFIDVASNKVIKRIEMVDLIEDSVELLKIQPEMSACRFLAYCNNKLYVVDLGLDCVYILNKDGTESELFGSRGNKGGEFRDPAGLAVDGFGTMMVVDSRNHRLQLIDNGLSFAGMVKVDKPLARPSGIFVDRVNRDIFVSNYLGRSVVKYKMVPT